MSKVDGELTLLLFVTRIFADNSDDVLTLNDAALLAESFD